jgi:hypothetical protein
MPTGQRPNQRDRSVAEALERGEVAGRLKAVVGL